MYFRSSKGSYTPLMNGGVKVTKKQMGAPLSFDMPGTRKLAAEMSGKCQKLEKKKDHDRNGWRRM